MPHPTLASTSIENSLGGGRQGAAEELESLKGGEQ